MSILTQAYITAMLGGATTGAAKSAALGDSTAIAAWIVAADNIVVEAARKGGYSSVTTTAPASGAAFDTLQLLSFREFYALAMRLGREIDTGVAPGEASQCLYVDSPENPRTDLAGLVRDALGGSSGGDIVSGNDASTDTATVPFFNRDYLTGSDPLGGGGFS